MRVLIALASAFAVSLFTPAARADVPEAIDEVLLPGFAGFTEAAGVLAEAAGGDCTPSTLIAPYDATWEAWLKVAGVLTGPTLNAQPHIAFWPDKKGFTVKTLKTLIAAESPLIDSAESFTEVSVAGKGLFALERLLYDPAFSSYAAGSYSCRLVQAIANELAAEAEALEAAWRDDFVPELLSAGSPDNATFLDAAEAMRALYTQVLHTLEFTADTRLGRPLGSFDRPRPTRAEARLAGRSLANVVASTDAAVALARGLADWDLPQTETALEAFHDAAARIEDPSFGDADDLGQRFKLEVLQQKVRGIAAAIEQEIGLTLGITPGFNSSDGD